MLGLNRLLYQAPISSITGARAIRPFNDETQNIASLHRMIMKKEAACIMQAASFFFH
ncbi:hypothetical protein N008_08930 [Hymenobacter sp. APR13]|nr:hypothetical protein N008_08930 [Hymenobacter sp. APR13]